MPMPLISGAWDRIIPVSQATAVVDRLPRGRLGVIPSCGHLPHVECPDPFVEAVRRSLDAA